MKIWMKGGSMREAGFDEPAGKEAFRHTTAHILAQAVKRLYPVLSALQLGNGFHIQPT